MLADRSSNEYQTGVEKFVEYCSSVCKNLKSIKCPCLSCGNTKSVRIKQLKDHLICNGIDRSYQNWTEHGEPKSSDKLCAKDNLNLDGEGSIPCDEFDYDRLPQMFDDIEDEFIDNPNEFEELLTNAEKPIYPNCAKFTKLSTLVRLFNLKVRHGVSNIFFSELLIFGFVLFILNNIRIIT